MNQLLESILNNNVEPKIIKIGTPFSFTEAMSDLGSDDWKASWVNFKNGKVNPADASVLWKGIDAVIERIGNDVYEKITNYINNVADIDFCGINQLDSICKYTDYSDNISILKFDYPSEIKELLDIFSIHQNRLMLTPDVLSLSSRFSILSSMLSWAPSLSTSDPRMTWTSDQPLIYITVSSDLQGGGDYYRVSSDQTINNEIKFESSQNILKTVKLHNITVGEEDREVAIIYNKDSKQILAESPDIDVVSAAYYDPAISAGNTTLSSAASISEASPGEFFPVFDNITFLNLRNTSKASIGEIQYIGVSSYDEEDLISPKYLIASYSTGGNIGLYVNNPTVVENEATYNEPIFISDPFVALNGSEFLPNPNADTLYKFAKLGLAKDIDDINNYIPIAYLPKQIIVNGANSSTLNGSYALDKSSLTNKRNINGARWSNGYESLTLNLEYFTEENPTITTGLTIPGLIQDSSRSEFRTTFFINSQRVRDLTNIKLFEINGIYNKTADGYLADEAAKIELSYKSRENVFYLKASFNGGYSITYSRSGDSTNIRYAEIPEDNWELFESTLPIGVEYYFTPYQLSNIHFYRMPINMQWVFSFASNIRLVQPYEPNEEDTRSLYVVQPPLDPINIGSNQITLTSVTSGIRLTSPTVMRATVSRYLRSMYTFSRASVTREEYKTFVKDIFNRVITAICTMPYRDAEVKKEKDPNYAYTSSDLIYKNKYLQFNGDGLFSTEPIYANADDEESMTSLKLNLNVPITFNEQIEYENLILGKTRFYDYSLAERSVLIAENNRRSEARIPGSNISKYYLARELKVKQYLQFLLTFYAYINDALDTAVSSDTTVINDSILKDYSFDNSYFEIDTSHVSSYIDQSVYSSPEELNMNLIDSIADSLAQACLDIADLREKVKRNVYRIFMKGTWNLIKTYVDEYIFNQLAPLVPEISSYLDTQFSINLIEYMDNTEYFNIQTKADDEYSMTQRSRLNPKYWESQDTRYLTVDNLSDSEISAFYYNVLGLKLLDENGKETTDYSRLRDFLNIVYQAGAVTEDTSEYSISDNAELKSAISKYSGSTIGQSPYYNYKNLTHPSFQLHQYIYNFTKYVYNRFSLENLFLNAEAVYAEDVQNNIESFIDKVGNVINKWIAGRFDFTGYNSDYETSNPVSDQYVRLDGPFNMYALNDYLHDPDNFVYSKWDTYYSKAGVESTERDQLNQALTDPAVKQAIKDLRTKIIYKYVTDRYGNSITLYKNADDKNETGTLWFRPYGHALSLPMFVVKDQQLIEWNFLQQYGDAAFDTLNEYIEHAPNGTSFISEIYDFELDYNNGYIALASRKIPDSEIASDATPIVNLKDWNYADALVSFFKLERTYSPNEYRYRYYVRQDNSTGHERIDDSSLSERNGISYIKQLAGFQIDNGVLYSAFIELPYLNGAMPLSESSVNTRYDTYVTYIADNYDSGYRSRKTFNVKVAYQLALELIQGTAIYKPLNVFLNLCNDYLYLTVEHPISDLNNSLKGSTYILNYPGCYSNNTKSAAPTDSSVIASNINSLTEWNIGMIDHAFTEYVMTTDISRGTPSVRYYYQHSDNTYIPLFPATQGKTNLWDSPGISQWDEYKLQFIGKALTSPRNAMIYEQASAVTDEETGRTTYAISSFQAFNLNALDPYDDAAGLVYTGHVDPSKFIDAPLITGETNLPILVVSAEINRLEYSDLRTALGYGTENYEHNLNALMGLVSTPLEWYIPQNSNNPDEVGQSLSAYFWQVPEQDQSMTEADMLRSIPVASELSALNDILVDSELDRYNNYGLFELDQGFTIGISYYISEDDSSAGPDPSPAVITHVKFYNGINQSAVTPIYFTRLDGDNWTKEITVSNVYGQRRTYRITLVSFNENDDNKIKFIASRV